MNRRINEFWRKIGNLNDRDYLYSVILFAAAPTLAFLKPSTLIGFNRARRNLYQLWRNRAAEIELLSRLFGLDYYCLHQTDQAAQVLFFRRQLLEGVVLDGCCRCLLNQYGYAAAATLEGYLEMFKARFNEGFPHEIGLLLGFPPDDVQGFMRHQGAGYLINGYWKVYSRPLSAQITFKLFDQSKLAVLQYLTLLGLI